MKHVAGNGLDRSCQLSENHISLWTLLYLDDSFAAHSLCWFARQNILIDGNDGWFYITVFLQRMNDTELIHVWRHTLHLHAEKEDIRQHHGCHDPRELVHATGASDAISGACNSLFYKYWTT